MLDRAIGIFGIALAIIFGFWTLAPEGWPKMPPWVLILGIGIGILLIGLIAAAVLSARAEIPGRGEAREPGIWGRAEADLVT